MALVYAFPPVGLLASSWTVEAPVQRGVSGISGRRVVSAAGAERRICALDVSALARDRAGAGYMEVLKRLLDGGVNLVRLRSPAINWHIDASRLDGLRGGTATEWTAGGTDLEWSATGQALVWFDGTWITGTRTTDARGFHAVTATGLPPSTVVARPGEFVTVYDPITGAAQTPVMVQTVARSDATGTATIRLMAQLPLASGRIDVGSQETAVFEAIDMPTPKQPLGDNWTYAWTFSEVFAEEVTGGFTEVDPWS